MMNYYSIVNNEIEIKKHLKVSGLSFEFFNTVSSTNDIAKEMAKSGKNECAVIIANSQTGGRGRLGRSFFSPSDSGIYMSIILRPQIEISQAILITTCAAVAVSKAIDSVTNKKSQIKWVNDIYIDNKKVCGILSEASLNSKNAKADFVILGIGINVSAPQNGFPDDIKNIADSLYCENTNYIKNKLIAEVLNNFFDDYKNLLDKSFYEEYKKRMFLINKEITVLSKTEYKATVIDVDRDFCLVVKKEDGEILRLNSGEVSTRF